MTNHDDNDRKPVRERRVLVDLVGRDDGWKGERREARFHRIAVGVIGAALLVACSRNIPRDQALARAKAARARGDLVGEALALREACGFAPDDKDLCKRAERSWGEAQGQAAASARAACASVETSPNGVDICLSAVAQVRRMAPDDPEAARLAESAARQHVAHCEAQAPAWKTSIDDALEVIRCEDARRDQIALPSYTQLVDNVRADARDRVLHMLDEPAFAGHPGAASELTAAAACLAPTPELANRARMARGQFVDRARASIDLRATTSTVLPDLCATAAGALGERAICGSPRAGAPQLTVVGDIAIAPVEHSAYDTTESAEYVAGIIRTPNPEYQAAVSQEQFARQSKEQAERDWRRDQSDCSSAESRLSSQSNCSDCQARTDRDRICNQERTSQQLYRDRENDWDRANRRLSETPAILERKDIRTASYVVRHHAWRASWRGSLRSDGKTTTPGGETVATDIETAGAPIAGVASDPLTYPGERWFVPAIRDQVAMKVAEAVAAGLERRASDLLVSCSGDPAWNGDWIDCWSRARLWRNATPTLDAFLRAVGDAGDHKRGAAWPPLRCR